ncbi:MAG: DUF433 domain-containing protein [Meiothermus sp.]|uniref:DUF433 domain-containing protein n=1 Tax=Meiothermus sp. TaxID=1955249 RepID=UPI0025F27307|nr:DUF433 domain-containing protein [Meiothermus sp.]MCS7069711.1 DUF433 domain-containing protein [Meiothermus sp.]MCX7602066.1 DUF433 domain-containing protein [Meiothermus sp.]MDW8426644.1 DUF433 domain-containing protein [Meiothermus sp.]
MKLGAKVRSELLSRIGSNPEVLRGRPRIKGTRIGVHMVLEALASQMSIEEVLVQWPELTRQDIRAALLYGARATNYEWIALHEE